MRWQRRARLFIGVFAVAFAIVVAFALKRRTPAVPPAPPVATAPGTLVQSSGGHIVRVTRSREDVTIEYQSQVTYSDNSTRLVGVKITSKERNGERTFTITGKEGQAGKDESSFVLDGDVRLAASDGLAVRTEHATYNDADGTVRAPGPVEFGRARFHGTGLGMTYDKGRDALAILDQAVVHVAPDEKGEGAADITAGTATFARRDKMIQFDRTVHVDRPSQTIDAASAVAHLTDDGKRIDSIDLAGGARIGSTGAASGGLRGLTGQTMNLKYAPNGDALQHAVIAGNASAELAGAAGHPGRAIVANTLDISLAPDGSTPTALVAREGVHLTIPAEPAQSGQPAAPARAIGADNMDAKGDAAHGITRAQFAGNVDYRETGNGAGRAAKSAVLDASLKPGFGDLEEARFTGNVRFEEGAMAAAGQTARYNVPKGTLELSGTPPQPPRMVNERLSVDAGHIDLTLAGPKVKATGNVKSVLHPPKPGDTSDTTKVPSMLKSDQPVYVTGKDLDYDGTASRAIYSGGAVLWQGDTSVKGASITIDDKTGNLAATGPVTTTTMLEQEDKDKKKERVRSIATAATFAYEEASRRATYTGGAHMSGPEGDITAEKIELYLKPSGDEVDKAEAYADGSDTVAIREQNRKTTGLHLTYTAADDRYVVVGKPATNVDACGNQTTGSTLTFVKATDTIVVDGNGFRTQTQSKGTGECK